MPQTFALRFPSSNHTLGSWASIEGATIVANEISDIIRTASGPIKLEIVSLGTAPPTPASERAIYMRDYRKGIRRRPKPEISSPSERAAEIHTAKILIEERIRLRCIGVNISYAKDKFNLDSWKLYP